MLELLGNILIIVAVVACMVLSGKIPMKDFGSKLKELLQWFACLMLLFVAGCSPIQNGTVIGKQFVPAHTHHYMRYDPLFKRMVNDSREIPDKWYVTFEKTEEDGDRYERTVEIGQSWYDSIEYGEWINIE